jgi:PAS domain S-box-containing protein
MIIPTSEGRFLATTFTPKVFGDRLIGIAQGKQHIELIDAQSTIVASSDTKDLSGFVRGVDRRHLLPSNANLPAIVRSRQAYWEETAGFMGDTGWTIRVVAPMEKSIEFLQGDHMQKFLTMFMISVTALFLIPFVSRPLSSPLRELTLAADMLTSSIDRTDVIWPTSNVKEVNSLVDQFKVFVQTINQDITERNIAQMALAESEERFSAMAKAFPFVIYIKDLDDRFLLTSNIYSKWYGIEGSIEGKTVFDLFPNEYAQIANEHDQAVCEKKKDIETEVEVPTPDGRLMTVHAVKFPIFDQNGEVRAVGGIDVDVSERKETAAQIIQASKLVTPGEMATSVAHELNQPLNVIRMAAANSRRKISNGTADPEYLNDKLERIEEQTARAAAIIDHMRMFGRAANEHPEPIDPRNVVTKALDLMGEQLRLAGIKIVTELAEDCPSILGHTI